MKSGTLIGLGLAVGAVVALAGGYYLNTYHYYQRISDVADVEIGEGRFGVSGYDGLDNPTLPLRLRSCFTLENPEAALAAGRPAPDAEPFDAPFWFECWDAERIDADLRTGAATAIVAGGHTVGEFVFERIVVIYPDGRAFQWRRLLEN